MQPNSDSTSTTKRLVKAASSNNRDVSSSPEASYVQPSFFLLLDLIYTFLAFFQRQNFTFILYTLLVTEHTQRSEELRT